MRYRAITVCTVLLLGVFATVGTASAQSDQQVSAVQAERAEQAQQAEQELRQLELARRELEEAARDVARRSAQLSGGPGRDYFRQLLINNPRRAMLGVSIEDAERGVHVVGVSPGGAAADAGVETGDVILALDGAELVKNGGTSASELLIAEMANVEPGEEVTLRLLHDGDERDVVVVAGRGVMEYFANRVERPGTLNAPYTPFVLPVDPAIRGPGGPFNLMIRWRDMQLVELSPDLGAYFGTETGILVVRAPSDGAFELADGDVILEIGGRTPTSPEHAMRILSSFEPGETLRLTIMRDKRRETLEFELPTPGRSG